MYSNGLHGTDSSGLHGTVRLKEYKVCIVADCTVRLE